jgi:hypothetical protein
MQVVVAFTLGALLALGNIISAFAQQTSPSEAYRGVGAQRVRNTEGENGDKCYLTAIVNKIDYGQSRVELVTEIGLFEVPVTLQVLQELQEGEVVMISFVEEKAAPQDREFI